MTITCSIDHLNGIDLIPSLHQPGIHMNGYRITGNTKIWTNYKITRSWS